MKTLKSYSPIFIQTLLLIAGFIMINAGLANETTALIANANISITDNELEPVTENWMSDLDFWLIEKNNSEEKEKVVKSNSTQSLLNEKVFEEEIEIEEWMKDANNNFWKNDSKLHEIDVEDDIVLEDWMTNPEKWNN